MSFNLIYVSVLSEVLFHDVVVSICVFLLGMFSRWRRSVLHCRPSTGSTCHPGPALPLIGSYSLLSLDGFVV